MATREQIDRAARVDRRPVGQMIDDRSTPYLYGATTPVEQAELDRAARLVARQAPDLLDVLGLPAPDRPATVSGRLGADYLDHLQRVLWEHGDDAAREAAADLLHLEARAARRELDRRRGRNG